MWEFLEDRPHRAKVFNDAMVAQSNATNWTVGIYPFEAELSKHETDENTTLIVDVGGGKGHVTRQIRELCPNVKGRIILQDRGDVISDISEPLPNVEMMEHDFFTPQPVKGMIPGIFLGQCNQLKETKTDDDSLRRSSHILHPSLSTRLV